MATEVWSMYEATISIWEQHPTTGAKIGGVLIPDRLVRGVSLTPNSEIRDIRQPGASPEDHFEYDDFLLRIDRFFYSKSEQFSTSSLFTRVSSVDSDYSRRFIIELSYFNRFTAETMLKELKECYSRYPDINASDTPAGVTTTSIEFRVVDPQ